MKDREEPLSEIQIDGETFNIESGKKRHIMFIVDSDWDESDFIENISRNRSVYNATESKSPMGGYEGENTIIFNNCKPDFKLLQSCSDIYRTFTPIPDTKYRVKYWPMYEERLMIVLLHNIPPYRNVPTFENRFNVIDLRK